MTQQVSATGFPEHDKATDAAGVPEDLKADALALTADLQSSAQPVDTGEALTSAKAGLVVSDSAAAFAESEHEYLREYIQFADQKAGVVLTTATAFLAFVYSRRLIDPLLRNPFDWQLPEAFGALAVILLLLASFHAARVIWPRRKGRISRALIFFDAVSQYPTAADYAVAVANSSEKHLVRVKLEHCHELAKVCSSKYNALGMALRTGTVGIGLGLLYLLATAS